jgi:hypothetical protein
MKTYIRLIVISASIFFSFSAFSQSDELSFGEIYKITGIESESDHSENLYIKSVYKTGDLIKINVSEINSGKEIIIRIHDFIGKEYASLITLERENITLRNYSMPAGIYIISIECDKQKTSGKFFLNR